LRKQFVVRKKYRASAEGYDELYAIEQSKKYSVVFPSLQPLGRILDAGCGTGLLEEYLVSSGLLDNTTMIICLDLTMEMLEKGLKKHRGKGLDELIEYVEADVEHLPLRDSCVNQVYAFTVMDLLDNPEKGLAEIKRVAKDTVVYSILKKLHSTGNKITGDYIGETEKDVIFVLKQADLLKGEYSKTL